MEQVYKPLEGYKLLISDILRVSKNSKWEKFSNLVVYGTLDEPLFPAGKVAEIVGMSNCRRTFALWRERFIDNYDKYVKLVRIENCSKNINVLTLYGLIYWVSNIKNETGRELHNFMLVLLIESAKKGMVKKDKVLDEYEKKTELGDFNVVKSHSVGRNRRKEVWTKRNGESVMGKCYCCEENLHILDMECGHIISHYHGGSTELENLEPICKKCNSQMGVMDMDKYMGK